jgi:DNA-binding transcriptional LysR family regulator
MKSDRHIDLHLLACLDALMAELHVTRAAERMKMTQPGMSNALARLRQKFQDPLLIRTPQGMIPTPRALELAASVRAALAHVDAALAPPGEFVAATASTHFRIAISDYVSLLIMPALMDRVQKEAPGVTVSTCVSDAKRFREWLEDGECHLSIGYYSRMTDGLRSSDLLLEQMCCIARRGHPELQGQITLEQYVRLPHVLMVGGSQAATFEVMIDDALEAMALSRRIVLRIQNLLVVPAVVAGGDTIATLPLRLAHRLRHFMPLQIMDLPFDVPSYRLSMVWHERTQHDCAQRWLRQTIRDVGQDISPSVQGDAERFATGLEQATNAS